MKILLILALILNVAGYGEIDEQGMDSTLTQAIYNPMTGEQLMQLEGTLLANGPLSVTITRSQTGISDEFCCAGLCTAGNEQTEQTLTYTPEGVASWYIHYTPAPESDTQISYLFQDNTDTLELRVRFLYSAQGIEYTIHNTSSIKKVLHSGQVQIRQGDKIYNIQGKQIAK